MNEQEGLHVTPDDKRIWWGEGEWVDEPDQYKFTHLGIECLVYRTIKFDGWKDQENKIPHIFGGFFCGYCRLPENHPWIGKGDDIDSEVHGGITFNESGDEGHLVGFDCSHLYDISPSMIETQKHIRENMKIRLPDIYREINNSSFQQTYKNVDFVIDECKKLAEEIKETYPQHLEVKDEQVDI